MDKLPIPDFADYFEQWSESSAALTTVPMVLVETSRGCWWGDKSHCTFCGLNGMNMTFRSKSADRAFAEMCYLSDRWQTTRIEVVDNILDMKYFSNLLPRLANSGRKWEIFYEVKANLTREQVASLRAAGVTRIQPGIESLSDHILKLMRKGTGSLRNIQLLKWCREFGIAVDWNLLYGFPGETQKDYSQILTLLRAIDFLGLPVACGPIRMDRFSPYFESPHQFGLTQVRPMQPYAYLYPFPAESLMKIAYYFEFDYSPEAPPADASEVIRYVEAWRQQPNRGQLSSIKRGDDLLLSDSRPGARTRQVVLTSVARAIYEYCDEFRSAGSILRFTAESASSPISAEQLQAFLDSLVANDLMATDGHNYLSLAIRVPTPCEDRGTRDLPLRPLRAPDDPEYAAPTGR